ncbi:hypothetical protein F9L16_20005 [Agarivorans sp. B2Z047]|uniref:hypothetical protein n=1 Tax=Agarivorans sp. B2Z047 TaxID=2652721 RepID=UPI00128BC67D|nr:hypothetical protein [Agarivorans sp. B2Z047]MPW31261.1 hypothetical protein [Agarivorans sp. B2Z047]UQN42773.1 hypothetical protein LQZ07_23860 [Agarivorans sp. B2Z047]
MRINRDSTIANLPAVIARDKMVSVRNYHNGFTVACYAKRFSISKKEAQEQIQAFESEGYLEQRLGKWQRTMKGSALAQATAAKPYKRCTADRHFKAFLDRVIDINNDDDYLCQVSQVALFGSYLTTKGPVGDIDLFVWTEIKPKFLADFAKIKESRAERMIDSGRSFKSHGELAYWPYLDATKYLKNKSKLIQIQGSNFGFERFEHKLVYTLGDTKPPQQIY